MFLVDRQKVAADSRHGSASSVQLRIREDGQLVELPLGKTTIGSGPRCTLRIERPGVEPLHCLIVHGPEGLSVRRWATDTRLNGATFDDARLAAGDCLELGGVELDLVDPLAVALDSLAELMPMFEAEKSVGLLPYFPMEETAVEVAAEAAARDEVASEEVGEEVGAKVDSGVASRERETAVWGDVERRADEAAADDVVAAVNTAVNETSTVAEEVVDDSESVAADVVDVECEDCIATVGINTDKERTHSADAVERVFQELQAACSVARGRNRKMLSALRDLRAEKESVELRIASANGQLPALADKMEAWAADRDLARNEQRELHAELQEVRRQLGEWEARIAEHLDQMVGLQKALESARTYTPAVVVGQTVAESLPVVETTPPPVVAVEYTAEEPNAETRVNALFARIERSTEAVLQLPAVDSVESPAVGPATSNDDVVPADFRAAIDELMHDTIAEPKKAEAEIAQDASADPWDLPAEASVDWSVPAAAEPKAKEFDAAPRAWGEVKQASVGGENEVSPVGSLGIASEVAHSAWEGDVADANGEALDDVSTFAEFSIWKQGAPGETTDDAAGNDAAAEQPKTDEASAWGAHAFGSAEVEQAPETFEASKLVAPEVVANPWAKSVGESVESEAVEPVSVPVQQASFIDRYSHLFAEEESAGNTGAVEKVVISPAAVEMPQPLMAARKEIKPAAVSGGADDEESIEQYMAKLLQRVRGDAAPSIASQVTGIRTDLNPSTPAKEVKPQKVETPATPETAATDGHQLSAEEQAAEVAVNWVAFTKRAATAPATNLGALRALANETARRDIGRHELRTFRRNAKTKVIVSTLAGMTSLWLMLDSPNWLDIQFITACLSLIVAAYWAGEAFRTMVYSMRVKSYDGPQSRDVAQTALPIDVEAETEEK